ncbi:MAG: ABC transporter permease [Mycobacteriales bacterium]|nr:ABC transporter permease [Frankia sp.]
MTEVAAVARRLGRRAVPHARLRWTISLIWILSRKAFQIRFKRSFLGILWVIVQPAVQAAVLIFIVLKVFRAAPSHDYPLYVLSGMVPWAFTLHSLGGATASVVENASLVRKVRVPSVVYPASAVGGYFIAFLAPLSLLCLTSLLNGAFSTATMLLPLAVVLHVALLLGVGTLTAGYYVTYRDVRHMIEAGTSLLFYLTPIIYELRQLPGWAQNVVRANPLCGVMSIYRAALVGRPLDGAAVLVSCLFTGAVLVLLPTAFARRAGEFADLV